MIRVLHLVINCKLFYVFHFILLREIDGLIAIKYDTWGSCYCVWLLLFWLVCFLLRLL